MTDTIRKKLETIRRVREHAPPAPWRYDSGNVQVEVTDSRLPVCDLATINDLSGDEYGTLLQLAYDQAVRRSQRGHPNCIGS